MTGPNSNPSGEHTPRPSVTWQTTLATTGERVVAGGQPQPLANRATRRAARRKRRTA